MRKQPISYRRARLDKSNLSLLNDYFKSIREKYRLDERESEMFNDIFRELRIEYNKLKDIEEEFNIRSLKRK